MIRLEDVEKRFGATRALAGVSFAVGRGEVVGLVGPNGAGKTTALRILTGFMRPDRGRVWVDGVDAVAERRAVAARVGYLPEGPPLHPEMRVEEYLRFRARLKGVARAELAARIDEVLEAVDVADRRRTLIGRLSRGYRQRVGLADVLLARPDALVLDEPTSGLDPVQVRELRRLLAVIGAERAVLLSSHALAELETVASRLVVLSEGRVTGDGTPGDLRARFGLPATASLEDVFVAATEPGARRGRGDAGSRPGSESGSGAGSRPASESASGAEPESKSESRSQSGSGSRAAPAGNPGAGRASGGVAARGVPGRKDPT